MLHSANIFIQHSFRDVSRHKLHYCLAFTSVLVVTLACLVVGSIVSRGPIIFLRLAQ